MSEILQFIIGVDIGWGIGLLALCIYLYFDK